MMQALAILLILISCTAPLAQEPAPDPNAPPPADSPETEEPAEEPQEEPPAPPEPQAPPPQAPQPARPAPPPEMPAPAHVTLGDFVMKVAAGLKLQAPTGGFIPESAAWALALQGIKVRAELASPVTEADAVTVLAGLGYRIRTTTPSRVMTADRVNLLMQTFIPPDKS